MIDWNVKLSGRDSSGRSYFAISYEFLEALIGGKQEESGL